MQQKVGIIGLGHVGITIAVFLCTRGLDVQGIDKDEELVAMLNQGKLAIKEANIPELVQKFISEGKLQTSIRMSDVKDTDVILVSVGTPLGEDSLPDMGAIEEVSNELARYLHKGHLIIYKSTVMPGTTEHVVLPILEKGSGLRVGRDFVLAYCPERVGEGSRMTDFSGSSLEEVSTLPIIVGGITSRCTDTAAEFWNSLEINTIKVSSPKVAELAKLADNWWIDLNIAIANELALLCEQMQVDSHEIINAANTLPKNNHNVNILLPGCGVGGSCLPKDPWFIYHLGRKYGLELKTCQLSREINDSMPNHMYNLINHALEDLGKHVKDAKIAILGLAFKQSTGDTRNTPAGPLIQLLVNNGAQVKAFDPWVKPEEARKVAANYVVDSLEKVLKDSECVVLINVQPEFEGISFSEIKQLLALPCAIVDGRRGFNSEEVIKAGFTYWSVGLGKKSPAKET